MPEPVNAFLNVDKPLGLTSHDVVAKVRRFVKQQTGTKKVGHAGTLDPLATGVLILCLGQVTRLSEYAMHATKHYRAQVHLGITTDTYDAEGDVTQQHDATHITQADVEAILPQFSGAIEQVPPMYSAIKQDGKKLYELAREGIEVERKTRAVTIHELTITAWDAPIFTLDVTCSSGTYIRSLAYDIGEQLGVGAHLAGLVRTRSGNFDLQNAVQLETFLQAEDWRQHLITPAAGLADLPRIDLSADDVREILYGRSISQTTTDNAEIVMAYTPDDHLVAVLEKRGDYWKPRKVFPPQT